MNRNEAITALVNYALEKELIEQEEKVWAVNRILEVMQADSFSWEESAKGKEAGLTEILDTLIDDAYERGVLEENSVVYRDLFDTKLMGSLTPRPVQVMKKFQQLQEESSQRQRTGIISSVRTRIISERTELRKISVGRLGQNMVRLTFPSTSQNRKKIQKQSQQQETNQFPIIHAACSARRMWDMPDDSIIRQDRITVLYQ